MEAVLLACTLAAFALTVTGAPYTDSEEAQLAAFGTQYPEEYQQFREARSKFRPQYVLPCAAAAATNPLQIPTYTSPYPFNVPGYGVPHYGYGTQHYRSVDEQLADPEMLEFSDMDQFQHGQARMTNHAPVGRFGAALAPVSAIASSLALNGPVLTSASGPAYGIFPNANVGGCNVPLLFSCSPSISSGHIMHSQAQISPVIGAASSYRLVAEPPHHEIHEQHSEEMSDQHLQPTHETNHGHQ